MASWRYPRGTGCVGPALWASNPNVCSAPRGEGPSSPPAVEPSGSTLAVPYGSLRWDPKRNKVWCRLLPPTSPNIRCDASAWACGVSLSCMWSSNQKGLQAHQWLQSVIIYRAHLVICVYTSGTTRSGICQRSSLFLHSLLPVGVEHWCKVTLENRLSHNSSEELATTWARRGNHVGGAEST